MLIKVLFLTVFVTAIMAELSLDEQWADYKKTYNRNYSPAEDKEHFEIFKESVARVNEINAKYATGEVSWQAGINEFSDRKPGEGFKGGVLPKPKGSTGTI